LGCVTTGRVSPFVVASAAREAGGLRVCFRFTRDREPERPPQLEASGGTLRAIAIAPDLRAVSALWVAPRGRLRCLFPPASAGERDASAEAREGTVEYVFLEEPGLRVTAQLAKACLLRPAIELQVDLDPALAPARLELPGGTVRPIGGGTSRVRVALSMDRRKVLRAKDARFTVVDASGGRHPFLLGVDDDGTPTATVGYVRNW